MPLKQPIKNQIISNITAKFKVKEIILFGSYAWGKPHQYSDIDLLVVLDKDGFSKSWIDRLKNRIAVSKTITEMRKKFPFDLLVYTKDEWNRLINIDSYFIRNINQNGMRLV